MNKKRSEFKTTLALMCFMPMALSMMVFLVLLNGFSHEDDFHKARRVGETTSLSSKAHSFSRSDK